MNSDEKNKTEDVGLPKSTLNNFIKDILTAQNSKSEKNCFDLIDKITLKYVNHISNVASLICAEKGKKTLNVDHVIEALKRMNFESHIKKLTSELDLSAIEKEENASELVQQKSSQEMKDLINKQKRKVKKRKKNHDFDEDMVQEQLKLFEQSKLESLQEMNQSYYHNFLSIDNNLKSNALMTGNNKKMRLDQIEMDLFAKDQNNKQEEEDFE